MLGMHSANYNKTRFAGDIRNNIYITVVARTNKSIVHTEMATQEKQVLQLNSLDPQALLQLQERIQADIERFAQSLQFFGRSSGIYNSAGKAINGLTDSSEGGATRM